MHYTKYLRWGIIGGLFLALLIPFIVASGSWFPGMFFPYITGKNFAFRIIVEIIFALYLILALRDPKYRPRSSWLMWGVCAFVVWMGVATILSVDPVKSFWGNFERMDGYITLLHLFLLFIVGGAVLSVDKLWKPLFQASVAVSVLEAIYAICQIFHLFGLAPSSQSGTRADGTFGNATYLAVYMLFSVFITLLLVAGVFKKGGRTMPTWLTLYGIAFVLQFFGLFLTETRGSVLGFVGGAIVMSFYVAIFARGASYKKIRITSWAVLGVIAVLIGSFFLLKNTPVVGSIPGLSRIASISFEETTVKSRLMYIWPMALKGAAEKPMFGWGQENFSFVFNKYYAPGMYNQEQWFDRAHNEFLDWLIAGGAPAALLYIALFILVAVAVIRSKTLGVSEKAVLLGLLAAYAFNNLFVFDNLLSLFYFYLLLAYVHDMSKRELTGWMLLSRPGSDQLVAIAAPVILVLVGGAFWILNVPAMARATTLIDALQSQDKTGKAYTTEDHLASFEKALTQGELGRQEVVEQLFQFASNAVAPSTSVSPETKQKTYTITQDAGKALENQRKNDARIELFMGVFYTQFGQFDNAIAEYDKSLSHSPNKQQILFQEGVTYLQQGKTAQALALFKKAYDLEPAYADARILYATGLYYSGQSADADKLLTDGFGTVLYDDNRLLQTYTSLKMYDRVIAIWNKRVEASPKDTNTLVGLASVYFQMGNTAQTIATLKKVEQVDPSLAGQMESIITQIQNGTLKAQ